MPAVTTRKLLKILTGVAVGMAVLFAGAWIAFVPSAKEPGYALATAWGERGAGPGQFRDPTGIAIADGEVFVADSRNGRIQVFDFDGAFKRQFGRPGTARGELGRPMNLTIHDNELYVPEYFNDRIQVFDLDGTPLRTIGEAGDGPGQLNAPGGVAVAANGELFVADFYGHRVQHLAPDGAFIAQWGKTGEPGRFAGEFTYPTDAAIGAGGAVFVADGYADRIQVFRPGDGFIDKWGGPFAIDIFGPFNGWFAVATSVAIDTDGNVFVADFYNDRVQKFAPDGTFLTAFGATGEGPGQFHHPIAVDVAEDGTVFVADFLNNRIQRWRPKQ